MGFQKCGINSIIRWWNNKGENVPSMHTTEDITSVNCIPTFLPFKDTHYPVVVTRNPVDAIWSIYHFFGYSRKYTLEEFLVIDEPNIQYGNNNPINRVDFAYHISKFQKHHIAIKIIDIDQMRAKYPDFPHENRTINMQLSTYRKYNESEAQIITNAIRNYNRDDLKFKVKLE